MIVELFSSQRVAHVLFKDVRVKGHTLNKCRSGTKKGHYVWETKTLNSISTFVYEWLHIKHQNKAFHAFALCNDTISTEMW